MLSDQICRYLVAAGDDMAAKHVRRKFQDHGRELDDFLRPKFLDAIDGWACATPADELRRMRIVAPDKIPEPGRGGVR
jgi:hypothetical protein